METIQKYVQMIIITKNNMKTTKQLIREIEDRSVFVLVWAIVWRLTLVELAIYGIMRLFNIAF